MHITVVSDLHLDARTGGMARCDDIERSLNESAMFANAKKSDLFICLGDVTDPDSGSCVFRVMRILLAIQEKLEMPSVWLAGNHDVIEDGSGMTTLEPLKPFAASVGGLVIDRPGYYSVHGIDMWALPFTAYSHRYDPKKSVIQNVDSPRLVLGHLNVKGAQPGDEEEMVRGRDVWLPVKEITTQWPNSTILNGHIHRRQITKDGVHIPGSLERLRFDEERHVPGWLELEMPDEG